MTIFFSFFSLGAQEIVKNAAVRKAAIIFLQNNIYSILVTIYRSKLDLCKKIYNLA
jgi:hypothetical protein